MGMKKSCSCGYWNQEQQECLYAGSTCIRDDEKATVSKEFIEKWTDKFNGIAQQGLIIDIDLIKQTLKEAGVRVG